jgi:hypothetical protein
MKTKLFLLALVLVLAGLLAQAHSRARGLQRRLDFQAANIKSLAAAQASADVSRGSASYYLMGLLTGDYADAFGSHFKDYGIRPIATGCKAFEAQKLYWDEYNRVVRDFLLTRQGKDVIQEFDTAYQTKHAAR